MGAGGGIWGASKYESPESIYRGTCTEALEKLGVLGC